MARRPPLISRECYEAGAGANLGKRRWHKPQVRPFTLAGRRLLVKDYRSCPWPWRWTYGRTMVRREAAIYRALRGLPGIPEYVGRIDGLAFVIERIDGRELGTFPPGGLPPGFLDHLEETVKAMHGRGVIHGDLRQRRNILAGPGGRPYLIDFASGVRLGADFPLFRWLQIPDLSAIAKLKAKHAPDTLTAEERRLMNLDRFRPFRSARLRQRRRR